MKTKTQGLALRKRKILKIIGASGLAFFVGIGTLYGVLLAPMNLAKASVGGGDVASSSNAGQGLITPKEDDPILFTTASGVAIKWAQSNLLSGSNLDGYTYFVTNDGNKDYCWVIIGANTNMTLTNAPINSIDDAINFEEDTPAGIAIGNEIKWHKLLAYFKNNISCTNEVPRNSFLCLLNTYTTTGSIVGAAPIVSGAYHYATCWPSGGIFSTLTGYYDKLSLGLNEIKDYIVEVELRSTGFVSSGSVSVFSTRVDINNYYIYTLSGNSSDTFYYKNYLTPAQAGLDIGWWLRGFSGGVSVDAHMGFIHEIQYVDTSGESQYANSYSTSYGCRPAFCISQNFFDEGGVIN